MVSKKKLQEIEDQILHILSASEGNILDDQTAIVTLQQSKIVSDDIGAKQKVADTTMQEIAATREEYKRVLEAQIRSKEERDAAEKAERSGSGFGAGFFGAFGRSDR